MRRSSLTKNQRPKYVVKANGNTEAFSKNKLTLSLARTGLPRKACEDIANKVTSEIRNGDKTQHIYKKAFNLIKERSPLATTRYSLKKALFELGPEGHYFEDYVARYFTRSGYKTQVCKIFQGKFVKHEVDCVAVNKDGEYFSECKFHNRSGTKNDVKISLYVKARWDDLRTGPDGKNLQGYYIFSNTAFTTDAIQYAQGTGLRLMGVNSPAEKSFLEEIKQMKLFPVTSLRSINRSQNRILLDKKIIVVNELNNDLLYKLGMDQLQINRVMEEVSLLLKGEL